MATAKLNKIQNEINKARERLVEQQARLRELESKKTEIENMAIVDIVRGMSIPLDDLAAVLQSLRGGVIPTAANPGTSGQVDPKYAGPKIKDGIDNTDTDKESETE